MDEKKSPEEKQLKLIRLQTWMLGLILLLILAFVVFMAVKVNSVMIMVEQIDLNQINEAVTSLRSAADKLAEVDVDALNQGIRGIADAAGELSGLDFQQLQGFMDSLEAMSTEIDSVTEVLRGLFRR